MVQPACGVGASFLNESLAPVSKAVKHNEHEKNWIIQSRCGVRPLDFRDHIAVRPLTSNPFPGRDQPRLISWRMAA